MILHPGLVILLMAAPGILSAGGLKALIVDGQNNHEWQQTTPELKRILEESGRFQVDVATSPPKGEDMNGFDPNFAAYSVVVSNYNGDDWAEDTKKAFERYVRGGGGFVVYHAADNSFSNWKEYSEMTGVGGWEDRTTPKSGSHLRFRDGKVVRDDTPGPCGHHGSKLPFAVTTRDASNPIVKGLPPVWMHAPDELYDSLCGPALNVNVLATAYSDPGNHGTGENEPVLMTIRYGKGRVFHTTLGDDTEAMQCAGFITILQRGTEWAATGKVTQKIPGNFPAADHVSLRK